MHLKSISNLTVLLVVACLFINTSSAAPDAPERIRSSFLGPIVGDALALFSQGEFIPDRIRSAIGKISNFQAPLKLPDGRERQGANQGKTAGDLTEVGTDIALVLREIAAELQADRAIDLDALCNKIAVAHGVEKNSVQSAALSTSLRFIPLLGVETDETLLAAKARQLVDATHRHEDPRDAAEFLARVSYRIIHSRQTPHEAISAVSSFMLKEHQNARNQRLKRRADGKSTSADKNDPNVDNDYDDGAVRLIRWIGAARKAALKAVFAANHSISFQEAGATDDDLMTLEAVPGRSASDPAYIDEDALAYLVKRENNFVIDHSLDDHVITEEEKFKDSMLDAHVRREREVRARNRPARQIHPRALFMLSKSGATETALPASLYLIYRYENLEDALIANAMLGGDAATRAGVIGLILGAHQGIDAIPARWISSLSEIGQISESLSKLPLVNQLARHSEL